MSSCSNSCGTCESSRELRGEGKAGDKKQCDIQQIKQLNVFGWFLI